MSFYTWSFKPHQVKYADDVMSGWHLEPWDALCQFTELG